MNIYAVIVTYQPDAEILKRLIAILRPQVSRIVLCNNNCGEPILCDAVVKEFCFDENLGIAAAQNVGMAWAFEQGADFVLQMDQDSEPEKNMVSALFSCFESAERLGLKVGLVGAQDYDARSGKINIARARKGVVIEKINAKSVTSNLSSGSLISKEAYIVNGGMYEELFIDMVDHEYCWRLISNGFNVLRTDEAVLWHRLGEGRYNFLGVLSLGVPKPFRHYYSFRNIIYLCLKCDYTPRYWKTIALFKLLFKMVIYPFLMTEGVTRLRFMCKGLYDGLMGRLGRL